MAPFYKTAAAFCLVGLFGLQSLATDATKYAFEIVDVKEDGYLTAKLARNGKISAKTNTVEKDAQLVADLQAKVKTNTQVEEATCSALVTEELKKFFHHTFNYTDELDYRTLVQQALKTGLDSIGKTYPENVEAWTNIWKKEEAASVLHLLGETSTKIGCVIGKCAQVLPAVDTYTASKAKTTTTAVLFCKLSPAATEGQAAFSEEYFEEISTRTTELKSMTEDDLTSSANVAVPSILTAGLVALLAAISA